MMRNAIGFGGRMRRPSFQGAEDPPQGVTEGGGADNPRRTLALGPEMLTRPLCAVKMMAPRLRRIS